MITPSQIRAARALVNLSQKEVADRAGITQVTVANIETGATRGSKNTLKLIQNALELAGVELITEGVRRREDIFRYLEGSDCFLRLLDDVYFHLRDSQGEVLFFGGDERQNTPDVTNSIRRILRAGIRFRMIVEEGNDYLMGDLNDYRYVSPKYFSNSVTVVYDQRFAVAISSPDHLRVHLIFDPLVAEAQKQRFDMAWDLGARPTRTSATEKY